MNGGGPRGSSAFHQVLILLAAYLFGGGGDQSLGERVRGAISDEERSEAAGAIADGIEGEIDRHLERVLEIRASFFEVAADYDATAQQLADALGQGVAEAERIQEALLDARFELRGVTKRREWKKICEGLEVME
jgi:hypothetical protein